MQKEKSEIYSLFPTAILKKEIDIEWNTEQFEVFQSSERIININNMTSINSNILQLECMKDLKNYCELALQEYCINILGFEEGNIKPYITQSWLNWTEQYKSHHKHQHGNSFLSGIFYIETDDDDKIYFYSRNVKQQTIIPNIKNFNIFNSDSWWLKADKNSLIIFPSNLDHEVGSKLTSNTRISLSFNSFLTGKLGDERSLTYLEL